MDDSKDAKQCIMCVAFGIGIPLPLDKESKLMVGDMVRDSDNPVFLHASEGLSDATHGYLFVQEKGEVRCIETTYGEAKKIVERALRV